MKFSFTLIAWRETFSSYPTGSFQLSRNTHDQQITFKFAFHRLISPWGENRPIASLARNNDLSVLPLPCCRCPRCLQRIPGYALSSGSMPPAASSKGANSAGWKLNRERDEEVKGATFQWSKGNRAPGSPRRGARMLPSEILFSLSPYVLLF